MRIYEDEILQAWTTRHSKKPEGMDQKISVYIYKDLYVYLNMVTAKLGKGAHREKGWVLTAKVRGVKLVAMISPNFPVMLQGFRAPKRRQGASDPMMPRKRPK